MALRPFWHGFLKLALVTCPVALSPATTEREALRFNTLNRETGNRVKSRYLDAETGEPVESWDQVKGYPVGRDQYLALDEDELKAVRLASVNVLNIDRFVSADEVGPLWRETPYFLTPDDPVAHEAFSVIRAAMVASGAVGISRWVRSTRERPVLLEPRGKGIVLWTLRYPDEIRPADDAFASIKPLDLPPELIEATGELIDAISGHWNRKRLRDPKRDALMQVIDAKVKGRKPPKPPAPPPVNERRTANIFDSLRKSLNEAKKRTDR